MKRRALWLALVVLSFWAVPARAHKASDSYLLLEADSQGARGRWDIALRDLNDALALDTNADGQLTWGELRASEPRIHEYASASLHAWSETRPCPLRFGALSTIEHSDGMYAALDVTLVCPAPTSSLRLRYDLLFSLDAQHRGIVRVGPTAAPIVLTKARREASLGLSRSGVAAFSAAVRVGVEHILQGYDHLLFLLALLLPSPLRRETGHWVAAGRFRTVLGDVVRIVTAFTVAHSLTLGLSAAHLVVLPARFVESAIALSVVLAAANNLYPVVRSERWFAALALGLLHGFGFAATLADAGLSKSSFLRTLLGFNFGVELGQLGVVLSVLPVMYGLSKWKPYRRFGLPLGSAAVLAVASIWLVERALDLRIIS